MFYSGDYLMNSVKFMKNFVQKPKKATLLGIGPMSEMVIKASIELGKELNFPVIFILSRNQIDCKEFGGGYVKGWDQQEFTNFVNRTVKEVEYKGPLLICRDHGGPWQRDEEKREKIPEKDAIEIAKKSYLADLKAGFKLLHIDPTKNPHLCGENLKEKILQHTIELIEYIERQRQELGIKEILYEVGTEDIVGGHTSPSDFENFIINLKGILKKKKLPNPTFIVGQTGTLVKMRENVGKFDKKTAKKLCQICRNYAIGFKEHNADYLPENVLKEHPEIGITAANVAPEFGAEETIACLKMAEMEKNIMGENSTQLSSLNERKKSIKKQINSKRRIINSSGNNYSNFEKILQEAVIKAGKWKKWMKDEDLQKLNEGKLNLELELEDDKEAAQQSKQMIKYVVEVCGHYEIDNPIVKSAREKMFNNLIKFNAVFDPEIEIKKAIKKSIEKYVKAFKLDSVNYHELENKTMR